MGSVHDGVARTCQEYYQVIIAVIHIVRLYINEMQLPVNLLLLFYFIVVYTTNKYTRITNWELSWLSQWADKFSPKVQHWVFTLPPGWFWRESLEDQMASQRASGEQIYHCQTSLLPVYVQARAHNDIYFIILPIFSIILFLFLLLIAIQKTDACYSKVVPVIHRWLQGNIS